MQCENYKTQFETSAKMITELQAENAEIKGLLGEIEASALLQARLQESLHRLSLKTQALVEENVATHQQSAEEADRLKNRLAGMQVDLEMAQTESKDLQVRKGQKDANCAMLKATCHIITTFGVNYFLLTNGL